jgi:hypothetical protein
MGSAGRAVAAIAVVAGVFVASEATATPVRCSRAGSQTVRESSTLRVYRLHGSYYGCLKSTGGTRFLARAHTFTEPQSRVGVETSTFGVSAVGGSWVAWSRQVIGTLGNSMSIDSIDLSDAAKRRVKISNDPTVPEGLAVSPRGQLAWLMPYTGGGLAVKFGSNEQLLAARLAPDHHDDLVLLSEGGVVVARGLGAGKFATPQLLVTGKNPLTFAVADVNGDGVPDLILGGGLGDVGVTVHLGRPDGTFGAAIKTSVPLSTVDVLDVADLNGDGRADVVAASQDPGSLGKIVVLLSKGNGRFQKPSTYSTGSNDDLANAVRIGDATGDGRPDIVAGFDTKIWVLKGHGNGSFTPLPAIHRHELHGPGIGSIAIGDLNGDHHPDIALAASYVEIYSGLGGDRFASLKRYRVDSPTLGLRSLAIGDVTGDGLPDVVAGGEEFPYVALLRSTRSRGLKPPRLLRVHDGEQEVALGDFGASGRLDIAVANFQESDVLLLLNSGHGRFTGPSLNQDLYVHDATGMRKISSDSSIPAGSLRFTGSVLHWRADGTAQQLTLH